MGGNTFGTEFQITTFGESHGEAVGVVLDGVTPGLELSASDIQAELDRRRPGQSDVSSPRGEPDRVQILSGMFEGKTTGTPLTMVIFNLDQRSKDYSEIAKKFRPGHADFTFQQKYGLRDYRGGGRSSGRETAGRVAAGAVAKKMLERMGVRLTAYTVKAAGVECQERDLTIIEQNPMRACDAEAAEKMAEKIAAAVEKGDSVGGVIECVISGAPAGLGEPVFDKLDAELAKAMLSIGGVKGIEFGAGFAAADMTGKEHNDEMTPDGFATNHAGGVLGGISTGADILFRLAVKPTSSIRMAQKTVDIDGNETTIEIQGRHDPCLTPRIVPVVEAMAALILVDLIKRNAALKA